MAIHIDGRESTAPAVVGRPYPAAPADHLLIQADDEFGTWLAQGGER